MDTKIQVKIVHRTAQGINHEDKNPNVRFFAGCVPDFKLVTFLSPKAQGACRDGCASAASSVAYKVPGINMRIVFECLGKPAGRFRSETSAETVVVDIVLALEGISHMK